jgi:hypothetical protein
VCSDWCVSISVLFLPEPVRDYRSIAVKARIAASNTVTRHDVRDCCLSGGAIKQEAEHDTHWSHPRHPESKWSRTCMN